MNSRALLFGYTLNYLSLLAIVLLDELRFVTVARAVHSILSFECGALIAGAASSFALLGVIGGDWG